MQHYTEVALSTQYYTGGALPMRRYSPYRLVWEKSEFADVWKGIHLQIEIEITIHFTLTG